MSELGYKIVMLPSVVVTSFHHILPLFQNLPCCLFPAAVTTLRRLKAAKSELRADASPVIEVINRICSQQSNQLFKSLDFGLGNFQFSNE